MIYSSREENGDRFCRGIFSWILKKEEGLRRAAPWCRREGLHKFVASQPVIARAHFSPVAILCGKDSSHTLGMTWRRESLKGFPSVTAPALHRCYKSVWIFAAGRTYYAFYALRGTEGYARKRKTTRFTRGFFMIPYSVLPYVSQPQRRACR